MAETPAFTRKTDHAIQTACAAMDANETSRQNSAVQERTEFRFNKTRNVPVALALPGEKRFQISTDQLVQRILFGIARPVSAVEGHNTIA
jgi:hypothetical protein